MSKISAVRLINISYNFDAIKIADETFHFNGESTLISLQNGGGKSVLVQMLSAPFVHKRFRNVKDRPFSSYFRSAQPSFILVEWSLDGGAGYVMTGMMVRRSQKMDDNNIEELELHTIIAEYSKPESYDIHHLPVLDKAGNGIHLKSYSTCKALFDNFKKNNTGHFFVYDLNSPSQQRSYFEKLQEYDIHHKEWENIMRKVNEEESGLSKLFADCKDEQGLIEKWFLDAITNKLNNQNDRVEEFRNMFEKYIMNYQRNEIRFKQRDAFLRFQEDATIIEQEINHLLASEANQLYAYRSLSAFHRELDALETKYTALQDEINNNLQLIDTKIQQNHHGRLSHQFYLKKDELNTFNNQMSSLLSYKTQKEEEARSNLHLLHLLHLAKQQEEVNECKKNRDEVKQRLDAATSNIASLEPERKYLGYLLKQYYGNEYLACLSKKEENNGALIKQQDTKEVTKLKIVEDEKAISQLNQNIGSYKSKIASFDQKEKAYQKKYKVDLTRNLMGTYNPGLLDTITYDLNQKLNASKTKLSQDEKLQIQTDEKISQLESTIQTQIEKKTNLQNDLKNAKQLLEDLERQKEERLTILKYLSLPENDLYSIDKLRSHAQKQKQIADDMVMKVNVEIHHLKEEKNKLETGSMVEISDEIKSMFEQLGIEIVQGLEYLKRSHYSQDKLDELLEIHPFLPYALIVSQRDLEKIEAMQDGVYTSFPIPLIIRESLGQNTKDNYGSLHFYMYFNDNLLDLEKLHLLLLHKQREIEAKENQLSHRLDEQNEAIKRIAILENQTLTKANYEQAKTQIISTQNSLNEIERNILSNKDDKIALENKKQHLASEIKDLQARYLQLQNHIEDHQNFVESYEVYLNDTNMLIDYQKSLEYENRMYEKDKQTLDTILDSIQQFKLNIERLVDQSKELETMLSKFDHYQYCERPSDFNSQNEDNISIISARYKAISENLSQEKQILEEVLEKNEKSLYKANNELIDMVNEYHIPEIEFKHIHYSKLEEDKAKADQIRIATEIKNSETQYINLDKQVALIQNDQSHLLKEMESICHQSSPIEREALIIVDFEANIHLLSHQKNEQAKQLKEVQNKKNDYHSLVDSLEEYRGESDITFEEDFENMDISGLRKFKVNLSSRHSESQKATHASRDQVKLTIEKLLREKTYQDAIFKKPLESLQHQSLDATKMNDYLHVVMHSFDTELKQLSADLAMIDLEKHELISTIESYVKQVHEELGKIDHNSTIKIRGKDVKMLRIQTAKWQDNEALYTHRCEAVVEEIATQGLAILNKQESIHEFIGKMITTKELYDRIISLASIHVQLYKIEANREIQINWSDVAKNSGGEGFLSAFVILSSLLYYMRRDERSSFMTGNAGKVLLMDNPFAQTNAEHLLKPLMDIANKNNTQLIALTGLGGESIYKRFDNIYVLNLIASNLANTSYLKGRHLSGSEREVLTLSHLEISDEDEQLTLF